MPKKTSTPKGVNPAVWRAHRAALRRNIKQKQEDEDFLSRAVVADQPPNGWPDKTGKLVLDVDPRAKQAAAVGPPPGPKKAKGSKPKTAAGDRDQILQSLALLKSVDITAFNRDAEIHFVWWLKDAISKADFQMVRLSWCYQNAAYELNISTETVKRYVVKHTADRAEFISKDGFLLIREKAKNA